MHTSAWRYFSIDLPPTPCSPSIQQQAECWLTPDLEVKDLAVTAAFTLLVGCILAIQNGGTFWPAREKLKGHVWLIGCHL
jgi:hypothetical protein